MTAYNENSSPDKAKLITPYDFQHEAVAALIASDGNPLAVLATGTGKSVVIAEVCRRLGCQVLILCPTRELCEQNEAAIRAVWPEADVGILCAGLKRREYGTRILIATIQSVYSLHKLGRLDAIGARELMIVDEAHLVPAHDVGMYRTIIAALKPAKVMGATATPYRSESGRLDEGDDRLFDRVVYEFGMREGIDWRGPNGARLLLPLVAKKTAAAIDTSGVKVRHGDFIESELQEKANTDVLVEAAVDEILRHAAGRHRWLAFCCGAEHAEHVAAALTERGVNAQAITYHTPSDVRRDTIAAFRRGEITCLTGRGIFTTGFNVPAVDLIAFLRPTKSTGLYVQMGGRGSRWALGKENCLVLDYARNVERLGPIDDPRIPDPKDKEDGEDRARRRPDDVKVCPECNTYVLASASYCSECGHVFEVESPGPKHSAVASDAPIMSDDLVWRGVQRISVCEHFNKQGGRSVKVVFLTAEGRWVPQWLSFDHPKAGYYARRHWRSLGGCLPEPFSTEEALRRSDEIRKPAAIGLKRDGEYWRVEKVRRANAG